jgi:hypothetical protein
MIILSAFAPNNRESKIRETKAEQKDINSLLESDTLILDSQ